MATLKYIQFTDAPNPTQPVLNQFSKRPFRPLQTVKPVRADVEKPSTSSALVPEDEYLGDDWLEHDVREAPNKRKRPLDVDHVFSTRGTRNRKSGSGDEDAHDDKRRRRRRERSGPSRSVEREVKVDACCVRRTWQAPAACESEELVLSSDSTIF